MIKNFLDADDDQTGPTTSPVETSIFDGLTEPDQKAQATDHLDPFLASDFRIDPIPPAPVKSESQFANPALPSEPFHYSPPTAAESSRMSGLAFTAGIAFVSSVAFLLVLGWLADTLLGTAPWGIVVGIILGSIIGFVQFFRLNSQILNSAKQSQPASFLDLGEKMPPDITLDDNPPDAEARTAEARTE